MDEQAIQDKMNIQLSETIPHEDDEDDIVPELSPNTYDKKHSKAWNSLVEQKAQEMEN